MAKNLWLIVLAVFISMGFYGFLVLIGPGFELIKYTYELLITLGISHWFIYTALVILMLIAYFVEFGIFIRILKCDN